MHFHFAPGEAALAKALVVAAVLVAFFVAAAAGVIGGIADAARTAGLACYGFYFFYVLARYPNLPKRSRQFMLATLFAGLTILLFLFEVGGPFDLGPARIPEFPRAR